MNSLNFLYVQTPSRGLLPLSKYIYSMNKENTYIYFLCVQTPLRGPLSLSSKYTNTKEHQGCIFRLTCSHPELTKDHVLTSAYVKIFRTVTRNDVNKSV